MSSFFVDTLPDLLTSIFTIGLFFATLVMAVATNKMSKATNQMTSVTESANQIAKIQFTQKKNNAQMFILSGLDNYENMLERVLDNDPQGKYIGISVNDFFNNLSDYAPYISDHNVAAKLSHLQYRISIYKFEYFNGSEYTSKVESQKELFDKHTDELLKKVKDLKKDIETSENWVILPRQ